MTVKTLQTVTGWLPLWSLILLRYAIEFIAACAVNTGDRARFVINFGKNASRRPQREFGPQGEFGRRSETGQQREFNWQSEFGVESKPAGRRLRPQFRGLRSEAMALAGVSGLLAGVAGDTRHGDELMGDVNWVVAA